MNRPADVTPPLRASTRQMPSLGAPARVVPPTRYSVEPLRRTAADSIATGRRAASFTAAACARAAAETARVTIGFGGCRGACGTMTGVAGAGTVSGDTESGRLVPDPRLRKRAASVIRANRPPRPTATGEARGEAAS